MSFKNVIPVLQTNIMDLKGNSNSSKNLLITSTITMELIYKLSDITPLLINFYKLSHDNNGIDLDYSKMFGENKTGARTIGAPAARALVRADGSRSKGNTRP